MLPADEFQFAGAVDHAATPGIIECQYRDVACFPGGGIHHGPDERDRTLRYAVTVQL